MKIKYLGTELLKVGPVFFVIVSIAGGKEKGGKNIRTRSSVLIDDDLMVDFPPDSYWHIVNYGIDASQIKHLVITHSHQDHFPSMI